MRQNIHTVILTLFWITAELSGAVYAVKTGEESFTYFSTAEGSKNVYYRHALENEASRVESTGYLVIGLDPTVDIRSFAETKRLRHAGSLGDNIHLFKNISAEGDVERCAVLWEEKGVRFAVPRFVTKKRLQ